MRHLYLVAYDVSEAKRLRRVYKKMNAYGDPLQYSVFQCNLSDVEKQRLIEQLTRIIKHDEDRIMLVDIGPEDGRARIAFEYLGVQPEPAEERVAIII